MCQTLKIDGTNLVHLTGKSTGQSSEVGESRVSLENCEDPVADEARSADVPRRAAALDGKARLQPQTDR